MKKIKKSEEKPNPFKKINKDLIKEIKKISDPQIKKVLNLMIEQ